MVYAVFWALETLRMCGPCHAGHIRKGRPRTHFLRVYAPAEPSTIPVAIASNKGGNKNTDNWQKEQQEALTVASKNFINSHFPKP